MLIYERYIIRSVTIPFLFSLVILTCLVWMTQLLKLVFILEKNVFFLDFLLMSMMVIPSLIHSVMPFSILYSSIFAINNLKINKEIIALETAGLNRNKISRPIIILTLTIASFALINSLIIMPLSYRSLKDKLHFFKSNFTSSIIEDGMFNTISKNVILYINKKSINNNFEGIVVFDNRKEQNSVLIAKNGEIVNNAKTTSLNLYNGSKQTINNKNTFELMMFDKFKVGLIQEKSSDRSFSERDIQELTIIDLLFPGKEVTKTKEALYAEASGRIIWALMNILLPFSAISLFLRTDFNRKGYNKYILKSILYSLIYVAMHFIALSLSTKNSNYLVFLYINLVLGFYISYRLTFNKNPAMQSLTL